jgi:acyl CoA:acetate/3-ketoacid CoA transferase alpha subunit
MRGAALLWYVTGGFLYTGEFNISDTAFVAGTHNFWGLASSTSDLLIGGVNNDQPSALTNIIAFANDSGDANLQIMYNDATGTATKTDLGSSFPSNRTAGAAITTIYSCYLYNAPGSTSVIYRIVNKETGATAQGTLSTNLPASTIGLNFFGVRTMGTTGGGITNSGQFDVYRLGVYSL